ncbi:MULTISPECIES: post-transcriptional regulator [Shouchella]|uniref:Post-transcriptional regulator n=3 Tax=Bacillaceae TaxID=186817 RepID=A0A060LUW0_9BACI|nr:MULTISPECIES: post-transcriptional regulator [Bacillaceae]RQW19814.1 hypothetical protein EH196_06620 [Bacillus sp. C1-1]AIC93962.1 hypothetical protein BleG1_1379 [Shouchella lehensis G1]KQL55899.1 hypothetical protein AN965_16590 [Alkalicoccobacillus plakortidis]MBG9785560.1 hypothetical protein [Shouchella lehensis]TES48000.1 hypothetical protein E2L03_12765 [Shouchella lehensis]
MGEKQQFEVWQEDVAPILSIKKDEFHELGYDRVSTADLWLYIVDKQKKRKTFMPFYAFVDELLSIKPQDYMTWLTVNTYKEPIDWFKEFEAATETKGIDS